MKLIQPTIKIDAPPHHRVGGYAILGGMGPDVRDGAGGAEAILRRPPVVLHALGLGGSIAVGASIRGAVTGQAMTTSNQRSG